MQDCGNGGLDQENEVKPLMEKYLKNLPIDIYIYIHLYGKDKHRTLMNMLTKETREKWKGKIG